MLETIEIVPPPGALYPSLVLPVMDAAPDAPIFVRKVTGLEPVDATVNTQSYGPTDGEFYTGSHVLKRNIVLTLGMNSVEAALPTIYGYLMTKAFVTLKFTTDGYPYKPVYIQGYVESMPFEHFSEDPEPQISIVCPKPNFYSDDIVVTGESGIAPTPTPVSYSGNEINGLSLVLEGGGSDYAGDLSIGVKNDAFVLDYRNFTLLGLALDGADSLIFSSPVGNKRVRTTSEINLLTLMSDDSWWITLWPGNNLFKVETPDSATPRDWTLTFVELYRGI